MVNNLIGSQQMDDIVLDGEHQYSDSLFVIVTVTLGDFFQTHSPGRLSLYYNFATSFFKGNLNLNHI